MPSRSSSLISEASVNRGGGLVNDCLEDGFFEPLLNKDKGMPGSRSGRILSVSSSGPE